MTHTEARDWAPALLAMAQQDDAVLFWGEAVELLQRVAPHRIAVVWSNSAVAMFVRDSASAPATADLGSAHTDRLRAGNLYNALGSTGYFVEVHRIEPAVFAGLPQAQEPLVREHGCDEVTTLAFMHDSEPTTWLQVSIALYGHAAEVPDLAVLRRLHAAMQPLIARRMREVQRSSFTAGLVDFLRGLPVGLVFVGWQNQVTFVNDEGYRQAHAWNTAPDGRAVKDVRERFEIAQDLNDAVATLRAEWVEGLQALQPPPFTQLVVTHVRVPELKAAVSLAFDPDRPLTTPNFVIRFTSLAGRAVDAGFEPSDVQLSALSQLTPAERAVAILVMRGLDNKAIAAQLHREVSTVKDHLTRVYAKLGLKSRAQLAGLNGMR